MAKATAAQSSEKLCMPFNQVVLNDLVFFHKEKQDVKSLTDLMRSAFGQIKEQLILFLLLFVRFGFGFGNMAGSRLSPGKPTADRGAGIVSHDLKWHQNRPYMHKV